MVNRYITFELLASELVHFDRRCANRNSTMLLGLGLLLLLPLLLQGAGFGHRAIFLERAGSNAAEETKSIRRWHEKRKSI